MEEVVEEEVVVVEEVVEEVAACAASWSSPSASLTSAIACQCAPLSWTPSASDSARRTLDCGESRSLSSSTCSITHAIWSWPACGTRRPSGVLPLGYAWLSESSCAIVVANVLSTSPCSRAPVRC